jgi:hypothetical protein
MAAHLYRVVVDGELGPRYASAFEGITISAHDGMTEMTGSIINPSRLEGLLEWIAGLGLRGAQRDTTRRRERCDHGQPVGAEIGVALDRRTA